MYEINFNTRKYVQKCPEEFTRLGENTCLPNCPLGWPDTGDHCVKIDGVIIVPFVWAAGDGADPKPFENKDYYDKWENIDEIN